jgi:hypothetical protein
MFWLLPLLTVFAFVHFFLLFPASFAIGAAAVVTILLWLLWKLKWVILGIIGLEEIFGGRGDDV